MTKITDTADGACDGDCSLREAIIAANQNPGTDTVNIPTGTYLLDITGTGEDSSANGDLDILESVIIQGAGEIATIVDGNHIDRVFHIVDAASTVTIQGVTVQNGNAPQNESLGGGGILNSGQLMIVDSTIQANSALRGAGLRNSLGRMTVQGSTIYNNIAIDEGGGIFNDGRLFLNNTQVEVNQAGRGAGIGTSLFADLRTSVLAGNTASNYGGGIYSDDVLYLEDVTLRGNTAPQGGGLYSDFEARLYRVTLDGNSSSGDGGGIFNRSNLELENVTLSANNSDIRGGAIWNEDVISIVHATFYKNVADFGGGIYNNFDAEITLVNSILAESTNGNCIDQGTIISLGNNIEDNNQCSLDPNLEDLIYTNPMLDSLKYNRGVTQSHALLVGSPAIDRGNQSFCSETDQRGMLRPVDGDVDGNLVCDVGAYEDAPGGLLAFEPKQYTTMESAGTITLTVTRPEGSGPVSVHYKSKSLSAWEVFDIEIANGDLFWNDGDVSPKTFQVVIVDDIFQEGQESFQVKLSRATGGVGILTPDHVAVGTIEANDPGGPIEPRIYLPIIIR